VGTNVYVYYITAVKTQVANPRSGMASYRVPLACLRERGPG
jgi:hypothetical protein